MLATLCLSQHLYNPSHPHLISVAPALLQYKPECVRECMSLALSSKENEH